MTWVAALFFLCMLLYAGLSLRAAWYFSRIRCESVPLISWPMVSVVVAIRNEAENLQDLLKALINQDYPDGNYEIILVDDGSEDSSKAIAWVWADRHPQIRILDSEPPEGTVAYKKEALELGIREANGEIIVQTDGDCTMGENWLRSMVQHFGPDTALVSGPIVLHHNDHLLQRLQSLELMGLVALGAGSMAGGFPNMVNGANLAFRKKVFEAVGGYSDIKQVASGDDELLLQKLLKHQPYEVRFARCQQAIVHTRPQENWEAFKAQRIRWVSKATHYLSRRTNLVQMVSYLAFLGLPVLLVLGFWEPQMAGIAVQLLVLKIAADLPLMYFASNFFGRLKLFKRDYLKLQLAYVPYVIWVGIAANFSHSYQWKGRNVK